MPGFLERLFPFRHLGEVHGRGFVEVRGRLASPNTVASPLTVVHAAILRYELFLRKLIRPPRGTQLDDDPFLAGGTDVLSSIPIGSDSLVAHDTLVHSSILFCDEEIFVECEGNRVCVPIAGTTVKFRTRRRPEPLWGVAPPALADAVARAAGSGEGDVCYCERFLRMDDPVQLLAWIRPMSADGVGPYRGGARGGASYAVCEPGAELVELESTRR